MTLANLFTMYDDVTGLQLYDLYTHYKKTYHILTTFLTNKNDKK